MPLAALRRALVVSLIDKVRYDRIRSSLGVGPVTFTQMLVDCWAQRYGSHELVDKRAAELVAAVRKYHGSDLLVRVFDLGLGIVVKRPDGRPLLSYR